MSEAFRSSVYWGVGFLVAGALLFVMLATDSNLAHGFVGLDRYIVGSYFIEWYAVFALAMAAFVGGALLIATRSRAVFKAGVVGAGLAVAVLLGAILTYPLVGFDSASGFAAYLFGLSYRGPGDTFGPHIVYLYDLTLGAFSAIFATGLVMLGWARAGELPASREVGSGSLS
ncbi:MAG: hypothetical protein ACREBT_06030 [Thermoplasmata archaeon]